MLKKIKLTEIEELSVLADNNRNTEEGIDISKLYTNSSKEINWKCKNGHTFKDKVSVIYETLKKY